MRRFLLAALLLLAGLAGSAQAASSINSFPAITSPGTFPLPDPGCTATSTENFWITQGNGNPSDFKIDALRAGYIFQGSTAPSCPFKYQLWWNTAPTLPELDVYDGSQWARIYSVDTTNHLLVPPIGGGQLPTIASAAMTDLCSATQSVMYVSGAASITSFGATCPVGTNKIVIWQASPTVVYNATTLILPGATNITPKPGDVWYLSAISGPGNWEMFFNQPASSFTGVTSFNGRTGVVTPQPGDYSFSQLGGSATNAQLPTTGAVGSSIGLAGTLASPNTSVTIQASSINVATTLSGTTYSLGNYTQVFNGATVGAGGMDTGAIPTSGNLCLYAIYNPTGNTQSILGVNCTTSSGTIYSGAHMPAGYTASAFLISWPTNGTPALVAGTISTPIPSLAATVTVLPAGPIGTVINPSGTLNSPAASITITADTVEVGTTLTGISYTLGSYSGAFNSGGTGAGGMDVGALPSNGAVCIYAIYNPVSAASSILGTNCSTSSGTIYGGSHMPAGYTASALLAHWPTNSTPNMTAGNICNWSNGTTTNGGAYSTGGCGVSSFNGATGAVSVTVSPMTPQGRLTLTSGTPVMTSTVSGATTMFYTPYVGNIVPVWNGTAWTNLACAELSNVTTNSAVGNAGPAAVVASSNYDLFVWSNSGTCTLTRAAVWTNNTTRANTLVYQNGILVNNSSITNGPTANQGTFVGTVHSNGSSTIDYIFGAAASGGTAASLQVWNEYNRVLTTTKVTDSGALYTYTSNSVRQARASAGNQISFVLGQSEDGISVDYTASGVAIANSGAVFWCIGLDSTSGCNGSPATQLQVVGATFGLGGTSAGMVLPGIGNHTISANEQSDGANANDFDNNSTNVLSAIIRN